MFKNTLVITFLTISVLTGCSADPMAPEVQGASLSPGADPQTPSLVINHKRMTAEEKVRYDQSIDVQLPRYQVAE